MIDVEASKVKKGQCILWHDDKILEVIDAISRGDAAAKERAKANSRAKKHLCIVMGNPEHIGGKQVKIPLLHCTKSTSTRYKDKIFRPLPHESQLYKSYMKDRTPLETIKGSPETDSQTYVVPYEIFYAITDADDYHVVRDLTMHAFQKSSF